MRRRELLASTTTPDGMRMTLSLHAGDYRIEVDGQGLMSTRAPGSEKALADLAVRELADNSRPRVLVGGLGLGFTLGAALDVLPVGASVVVVEFFETVVDWNRKFGLGTIHLTILVAVMLSPSVGNLSSDFRIESWLARDIGNDPSTIDHSIQAFC